MCDLVRVKARVALAMVRHDDSARLPEVHSSIGQIERRLGLVA